MDPKARTNNAQLENRLEFETLISDTSALLITTPPESLDLTVAQALERVRMFFQVDRCALLSVSANQQVVNVLTASYGEGVPEVSPEINLVELFPWSAHRLLVERLPVRIQRMSELPIEAEVETEVWNLMQIRSALTLPIEGAGTVSHLMLLNAVHQECDWPDAFVTRLRVLGELLVGALERQRLFCECRNSENRLKMAADFAEAGFWTIDRTADNIWSTEKLRTIFGFTSETEINLDQFKKIVHPGDLDSLQTAIERSMAHQEPLDVEYRVILPEDGGVKWIGSRGGHSFSLEGKVENLMGVSFDITRQKLAEEALRMSEERLASAAQLAGLGFYEVNFEAGTIFIDPSLGDLIGLPPEKEEGLLGLEFWMDQIHPDDRPWMTRKREQLHGGSIDQISIEYRYNHPATGLRWFHHLARIAKRDARGKTVLSFGVIRDVTHRRVAENKLHKLSRSLIHAHEEERALLARELHDDLTQRLAVLAIEIGNSELTIQDGELARKMQSVREELIRLSRDVHSLAYQLHPSILAELGLVEALRAESDRRERQGNLTVSLNLCPLPTNLGNDVALCMFRVTQEALNNVTRHSGVRQAEVTLEESDEGISLSIKDQGSGFDPDNKNDGMHLGLMSMRERMRLVNGNIEIISSPDEGTTISAWAPLNGEAP